MTRTWWWIASSVCVFLLGGCPPPSLSPAFRYEQAASLLAHHAGGRAGLLAIQAEARVDQRGEQGRIRGTVLMFVERSGRVRFDVMTQFGPVLTLTSDGEAFALNDMRERKFLHGPACQANIARLLGMPVTARQAASLLLGGVPQLEAVDERLEWVGEEGRYHVTRRASNGLIARMALSLRPEDEKVELPAQRFRLMTSSLEGPDGHLYWRAEYDDYTWVRTPDGGGFDVPFKVRVQQPSSDTDTLVKFQEVIPNPDIPPEAFVQGVPSGVTVEEASCD